VRLAAKLTFALSLVIAIGLVVQAGLHVRSVRSLHQQELRNDVAQLAHTTQTAVAELWSIAGEGRARAFVERTNGSRTTTELALVEAVPADAPSKPVRRAGRVLLYTPVIVDAEPVAFLRVQRSLEPESTLIGSVTNTQLWTTLVLLAACAATTLALGVWFVGKPTEHLIAQTQRVARGDYRPVKEIRQRDEIGELARAMNEMAQHLHDARDEVDRERHARTLALEQLRHADRLSTVGKLASGIAHELGTPLNVVAGRAMMIASGEATGEEIAQNAKIIADRAQHMTQTIRKMLDFSRRRGLKKEPTSIPDLIGRARALVEPLAREQRIRVELESPELRADIDPRKTLQALTNLMMNGIQSMPEGGTLHVRASRERVNTPPDSRSVAGAYVSIAVEDEGPAIPSEHLQRIFEPFFTASPDEDGARLGLSVSQGLVREHGGWMDVRNRPKLGTCFTVFLPQGGDV